MSKQTIKKGDQVIVISGSHKGEVGEVLEVLAPKMDRTKAGLPRPRTSTGTRYLVRDVNLVKRHTKKQGNDEGGIIEKPAPLPATKVALLATYKGKKPEDAQTEEKPAKAKKTKKND